MPRLNTLAPYKDEEGNSIEYGGPEVPRVEVEFKGANNRLVVSADALLADLKAVFWGDNGTAVIGPTTAPRSAMRFELRLGHDSAITIGKDVGCAGRVFVSAVEGTEVVLGDDIMFSQSIEIRTDDSHAIFDVNSGERINPSRSIKIGSHVWVGKHVVVMGGVNVGDGTVIGFRSIVTASLPNNCVAVGSPARIVRRDIAWERPLLAEKFPNETELPVEERTVAFWKKTIDRSGDPRSDRTTGVVKAPRRWSTWRLSRPGNSSYPHR